MERIYCNGTILTMRYPRETAQAVLTRNGKIALVGSIENVRCAAGNHAEVFDLEGKTMLPAFLDGHGHLSMLAQNLAQADLSAARSFQDIIDLLRTFRAKNALFHGEYIVGFGYDENRLLEKRHPNRQILDQVSDENPIFISHVSFHMGVANTLALKQARIFRNNECTGYLAETDMTAIYAQAAESKLPVEHLYKKAQDVYLQNGICTIQDGAVGKEQFQQLQELADQRLFQVDVAAYLMMTDDAHSVVQANASLLQTYQKHLKIGGYKLVLDGSPQGKTAWMREPYTDGTNGSAWMRDDEVKAFALQAVNDGVQLMAHCNGDAASEQFLNSYQYALEHSGRKNTQKLRPVMLHSQTVRRDQLNRFSDLGMIPSFFVDHVYRWGDVHRENLGQTRAQNISPVGWAEEFCLPYTFHQDTPVLPPNMLRTIQTAVQRVTEQGVLLGKQHTISVYQALQAVTIHTAFQYGEEKQKGSIEKNKQADFVILDQNPLQVDTQALTDIHIMHTIAKDQIVYRRK